MRSLQSIFRSLIKKRDKTYKTYKNTVGKFAP